MSEKYPRAWLIFTSRGKYLEMVYSSVQDAERNAIPSDSIIELIPLPEHEAIVAAAVAAERQRGDDALALEGVMSIADAVIARDEAVVAERERCAGIANAVEHEIEYANAEDLTDYEHGWLAATEEIICRIREVPE